MNSMTPLLNVEDASRSLGFYRDNLGFRVDEDFEHKGKLVWARISLGPIALMINTSEERTARGARSSRETYDDAVFYFTVDDARALRKELAERGCDPGPVARQEYGVDEFTMQDPDGYELAFGSPIPAGSPVKVESSM